MKNMKRIFLAVIIVFAASGCKASTNTPEVILQQPAKAKEAAKQATDRTKEIQESLPLESIPK